MSTGFLLSRVPALDAGAGERADAVLILGQLLGGGALIDDAPVLS